VATTVGARHRPLWDDGGQTLACEPRPATHGRDRTKCPITGTRLCKPEGLRSNSRGQRPRFGTATPASLSLFAAILKGSNLQPSHAASLLLDPFRVHPTCVPRTHRGRCPRLFHASPSGLTDRRVAPRTPDMPPSSELCRAPGKARSGIGSLGPMPAERGRGIGSQPSL